MRSRNLTLAGVGLLTAMAAALLFARPGGYQADLRAAVEIWADVVRDADNFGLTLTGVSTKREMEIGREIETRIGRRAGIDDDPKLRRYVEDVGAAVAEHVARKGITYRFHVMRAPMVNAFALPGGVIYVTTGMIEFLQSEAELAAILGHEASHVDLKHCIGRLQYELTVRKVVGRDLAAVAQVGYTILALGFSKQQELEADANGVILAAKAGYNPRAAQAVWQRLAARQPAPPLRTKPPLVIAELAGSVVDALEQYVVTHPLPPERFERLQAVYVRNDVVWRDKRFYVGLRNHSNRVSRTSDDQTAEWQPYISVR